MAVIRWVWPRRHESISQNGQPDFRISLHRLRAIAALLVVFSHAFQIRSLHPAMYELAPLFMLVSSGTILFVFLAGILFSERIVPKLSEGRTNTAEILRKRWAEMRGYYLLIGGFLALLFTVKVGYAAADDIGYAARFLRYMLNGGMAHSYWYVPFFLLLMAVAPLHLWFARRGLLVQLALIAVGLGVSSFVHRPSTGTYHAAFHSLVYYLPVFWAGMVAGANWVRFMQFLLDWKLLLAATLLVVCVLQLWIGQTATYFSVIPDLSKIDLFVFQKLLMALLLIAVFELSEGLAMPLLDWVAKVSLSIFFMHPVALFIFLEAPHLSGFYVPELVLMTAAMIFVGLRLEQTGRSVLEKLGTRVFSKINHQPWTFANPQQNSADVMKANV